MSAINILSSVIFIVLGVQFLLFTIEKVSPLFLSNHCENQVVREKERWILVGADFRFLDKGAIFLKKIYLYIILCETVELDVRIGLTPLFR